MGTNALRLMLLLSVTTAVPIVHATGQDGQDDCIRQFLEQADARPAYVAIRRLEASNGGSRGWLEARTQFSPETGFQYEVLSEGGSSYIRTKVLRAVLDGEREIIVRGEAARSSLTPENYTFAPGGVDESGLAAVVLSPKREERTLVDGTMFLQPADGALVRLQGRLAKSPSFWIKNVDIVRTYDRIHGAVVPVRLESRADLRFLGSATLQMTYTYAEVGGRSVASTRARSTP